MIDPLELERTDKEAWESIRSDPTLIKWVFLPTFEMLMYVRSQGITIDKINYIRLTPDQIEYIGLL